MQVYLLQLIPKLLAVHNVTNMWSIYLTGAQYLDGTTDTTRTFHYGTPTEFEKEAYTRVLMGVIDLARATFISDHGTTDSRLDILAR